MNQTMFVIGQIRTAHARALVNAALPFTIRLRFDSGANIVYTFPNLSGCGSTQ